MNKHITMKNGVAYDNEVYPTQCELVCQICGRRKGAKHKYTCRYFNHQGSIVRDADNN